MKEKRRRRQRQTIDLEQVRNDPESLLSWGIDDPTLRKLETYRLYQAGYAAVDIAEAFDLSRGYLYEMWAKFEAEGSEALVDKRWGSALRKRTPEREAAVLRAKALEPQRGDSELAAEFGMDRTTVYHLLKEHGLQDLHRVLDGTASEESDETPPPASAGGGEKGGPKSSPVKRLCS